jgi:transposase InsO family protein
MSFIRKMRFTRVDILQIVTKSAKSYGAALAATVIDLYSRRVIGWSVAAHVRTELVADALKMAIATRRGTIAAGVVFHSDRGSAQYT